MDGGAGLYPGNWGISTCNQRFTISTGGSLGRGRGVRGVGSHFRRNIEKKVRYFFNPFHYLFSLVSYLVYKSNEKKTTSEAPCGYSPKFRGDGGGGGGGGGGGVGEGASEPLKSLALL